MRNTNGMKSSEKLLLIINEELQMVETALEGHALDRLKERLDLMTKNGDITPKEDNTIRSTLNNIISYEFAPNKSFGIFLGSFTPNPNSKLYTITNSHNMGVPFYEIYVADKSEILKDSTGDEFWAVIRNNKITTVMLRKRLQREFAGNERNDRGGLGVDHVIPNFDKFIDTINKEKEIHKEKEQVRLKQVEKTVNIKGVAWIIDDAKQIVYKKNNPNIFVKFDDVLDYPNWDDQTKEDILNRIG
jgi:hypothetical protein